ncbi:MAG: hypothetical protein KDD44_05510 [Bdellovibrionales bacterium]|nr:hypothetical protein [Bdellovibrionales bacterium]
MGRRPRLRTALRSRSKLITIWTLLLVLAVGFRLFQWCEGKTGGRCIEQLGYFSRWIPALLVASIVIVVVRILLARVSRRPLAGEAPFVREPARHDRATIRIRGQVQRILKDTAGEVLKRKMVDLTRTLLKNEDPVGRYIHQRFLISSPALPEKETVLVFHNIAYGRLPLKRGVWLEIQGQYIHQTAKRRTWFGVQETRFGRLHFCHEPLGYIRRLPEPVQELSCRNVLVVEPPKAGKT